MVEGVIFDLDPGEIESLDKIEGLGHGYKKKSVHLVDFNGVEAKRSPTLLRISMNLCAHFLGTEITF